MEGFNEIHNTNAIPGDRVKHGATVYDVLLTRDTYVVGRDQKTKKKVDLPLQYMSGGMMTLYRRVDKVVEIIDVKPVKTASKRVSDKPTKLDVCRQIYAANSDKSKADMLDQFIVQAGCTKAGANTYYCLLKKQAQ